MGLTARMDVDDPVVAETDEEIHKHVQEAAIQTRATHVHVNLHVTDWWPLNGKIQCSRP